MMANSNDGDLDGVTERMASSFICGVVEGFYGQPWTMEQRRKLFNRMASLGMNTYIYAPKDDLKHRMHWRDMYTVDEADPLTTLIESAREAGVTFVYAISPGIDITYSSSKDITCLKHKLEQVASFGCEAFAVLFDDIDVELCDADKSLYQSFASAQVSVTNEVYQHLSQPPNFYFCPTEYCASRAVPSVSQSEYLTTVGTKLLPNIDVMWTGPKVISKRITTHSIEEVSRVLKRPPLIWDNIHANDYDPKRLFLGPYDGRSPKLVPHLRGVLTNPNCEFESDFVALHTLAQWSRASEESSSQGKKDLMLRSPDVRLETEGSSTDDDDDEDEGIADTTAASAVQRYSPRQALRRAVAAWLPEFSVSTAPSSSLIQKPAPGLLPPAVIPAAVPSVCASMNKAVDQMAILEVGDGYVQPTPAAIPVNSLHELSESEPESSASSVVDVEPMDCAIPLPVPLPPCVESSVESSAYGTNDEIEVSDTSLPVDETPTVTDLPSTASETMQVDSEVSVPAISIDDVMTVVDMFYLPFEHGSRAAKLLTDFFELKLQAADSIQETSTADQLLASCCDGCETESTETLATSEVAPNDWRSQAHTFIIRLRWICDVIDRVLAIPNKALALELFPYLWDVKSAICLVDCYVQWLADCAKLSSTSRYYLYGSPFTWANKFYRDQLMCRDQEPWLFRGGLLGELQRMLPFENCPDLLFYPFPSWPQTGMCRIRPYKSTDKEIVYELCRKTYFDGSDGTHLSPDHKDLLADKVVGPFLAYGAEHCFVIVDPQGDACGYIVTAPDANAFCDSVANKWLPHLQQKYPLPHNDTAAPKTPGSAIIESFHAEPSTPPVVADSCQSVVRIDIMPQWRGPTSTDSSTVKRALACAVATLKVGGSRGICTTLDSMHTATIEAYRGLGFAELSLDGASAASGLITLGRPI